MTRSIAFICFIQFSRKRLWKKEVQSYTNTVPFQEARLLPSFNVLNSVSIKFSTVKKGNSISWVQESLPVDELLLHRDWLIRHVRIQKLLGYLRNSASKYRMQEYKNLQTKWFGCSCRCSSKMEMRCGCLRGGIHVLSLRGRALLKRPLQNHCSHHGTARYPDLLLGFRPVESKKCRNVKKKQILTW